MSSSIHYNLIILFFAGATFSVSCKTNFKNPKPTAHLFPIRKDTKSTPVLHFFGHFQTRQQVELVLNLGGQHTWFNCDAYQLPTYNPIMCMGDGCMRCAHPHTPGCTNDACIVYSYNAIQGLVGILPLGLGEDTLYVESTNGLSVGLSDQSPEPFPFTCAVSDILRGLSNETKGMVPDEYNSQLDPFIMYEECVFLGGEATTLIFIAIEMLMGYEMVEGKNPLAFNTDTNL
ncbi:hypothetical protein POM88_038020 [Heracleum sosnowskyi]|uniref:Xylanase inhibitor N-terminal domain-containing protein n=1 Tax=Heracleum sosnowskyi TaxID=360622 RepID=A0AAD8MHA8_9APIA|nr:hypothetical protein POM88_038020 [Heracleum sosnowskyi]